MTRKSIEMACSEWIEAINAAQILVKETLGILDKFYARWGISVVVKEKSIARLRWRDGAGCKAHQLFLSCDLFWLVPFSISFLVEM